jgi:hypothetical protein
MENTDSLISNFFKTGSFISIIDEHKNNKIKIEDENSDSDTPENSSIEVAKEECIENNDFNHNQNSKGVQHITKDLKK